VALDQSFIGREYPPSPAYEVSREKLREFADAIGDPSPVYRDVEAARAAGYPDVIAPPTFAVLISMKANDAIIGDPDLGLDYSRVVHGDQSFVHHRPIVAGDRLVAVGHVDDVMTRAGNDFLSVRAELATENGEPVTTSRATLVARGTGEGAKEAGA
jgi:acyl dehydratase